MQGTQQPARVIALAAARIQNHRLFRLIRQLQYKRIQAIAERLIMARIKNPAACRQHLLSIAGKLCMHPVGGQQMHIPLFCKIEAVPMRA